MTNPTLLALIILFGPAPLFCQQQPTIDIEKESQKPAREERQKEKIQGEATEAAQREAPGQAVTWEQIMANPDDIRLNYDYARTQVRLGDVKGAAATLERILMLDPNQNEVRLFYAVVLYRLDNMAESQKELEALKGLPLAGPLRAEADRYLSAVRQRQKLTHISGSLSLGFEYDTNRNAEPASGQADFGGQSIPLATARRDDTSLIFMGNVGVRRDLGTQAGHELFGNFSYYQAEQTLVKNLNLKAYSLQAGGVIKADRVKITPAALFDHVQLAQATFLRDEGGDVRFDVPYHRRTNFFAEFKDAYQDYSRTEVVPTGPDLRGAQADLTAGSEHLLGASMKLGTLVGYSRKNASAGWWAFHRWAAGLNHTWLLGRGTFLLNSLAMNFDRYDTPDVALNSTLRRDTTLRYSVTLGGPLSLLHPKLQDLLWTLNYEYYHDFSTVQNYDYFNNKFAAMLTYKWEVGL